MAVHMLKIAQIICFIILFFTAEYKTVEGKEVPVSGKNNLGTAIEKSYGKLPLYFIENKGQNNTDIVFSTQLLNQSVYFKKDKIIFDSTKEEGRSIFTLGIRNINKESQIIGEKRQKGKFNYLFGKKDEWKTEISTYAGIKYKEIYAGIDLTIFGNGKNLEYEFVVRPNIDPKQISLFYDGVDGLRINDEGELIIETADGDLKENKPYIYQIINGKKVEIEGRFVLLNKKYYQKNKQYAYNFALSSYNKNVPVVIDPSLVYSTYLGGLGGDKGYSIKVDADGNAYVTGDASKNFKGTKKGTFPGGVSSVFVTKFDPSGKSLIYSTYIGGTGVDGSRALAIDADGYVYITGSTTSTDFATVNAYQNSNAGGSTDAFLAKLNKAGNGLEYFTYFGGTDSDYADGIAVDKSGNAYIVGGTKSSGLPIAGAKPYQKTIGGMEDVFIAKFNTKTSSNASLVYSTFLGGSDDEKTGAGKGLHDIAIDSLGNAYIAGNTKSKDFPIKKAYQSNKVNKADAFVTKLNPGGSGIEFSTYLGGAGDDFASGIAVDSQKSAYITGFTYSKDFPTKNALQPKKGSNGGTLTAFITKFKPSGKKLDFSTYLGGSYGAQAFAIALDKSDNVYITGSTSSKDFPTKDSIQPWVNALLVFATKLDTNGSKLDFSTYLGGFIAGSQKGYGVTVDDSGDMYITGSVQSVDFPTKNAIQKNKSGAMANAFVSKITICNNPNPKVLAVPSLSIPPTIGEGEGAVYQAYYKPSRDDGEGEVKWTGYLQALWIDKAGYLHEDTKGNGKLDLPGDNIVIFKKTPVGSPANGNWKTKIDKYSYSDKDGDGIPDGSLSNFKNVAPNVSIDKINPIFEAGKKLAERDKKNKRKIYTFLDIDEDGKFTTSDKFIEFNKSKKKDLRPFLNATDGVAKSQDEVDDIIDFIRGKDIAAYRNRTVKINGKKREWILGDIVSSNPVAVGRPNERYDLLYKDSSYLDFLKKYEDRRTTIYAGANDGMLHAFNGGKFTPRTSSSAKAEYKGKGYKLGEEIWAFIPYDLLPHLKALKDKNYSHDFYVDLDVYVTDAKIFGTGAKKDWGTILIGGMKFGGSEISFSDKFNGGKKKTRHFMSSYFALDVTNPKQPKVLWRFNCEINQNCQDPIDKLPEHNLGFSTSYPAVAKVNNSWFLVLGSGPSVNSAEYQNGYEGNSSRKPYIYVLDLKSGQLLKDMLINIPSYGKDSSGSAGYNGFISDIVAVDADMSEKQSNKDDYSTEVIYASVTYKGVKGWKSEVLRIPTNSSSNPVNWGLSTLFKTEDGQPVTASAAVYKKNSKLWISFGTGKLFNDNDRQNGGGQSFYNVSDSCWNSAKSEYTKNCSDTFLKMSLLTDSTNVKVIDSIAGLTAFQALKKSTQAAKGWYLNFGTTNPGERVLSHPVIMDDLIIFTTYTPDGKTCFPDGTSNLYALSFAAGTAYYDNKQTKIFGLDKQGEVKKKYYLGGGISGSPLVRIRNDNGAIKGNLYVPGNGGEIKNIELSGIPSNIVSGMQSWKNGN